MDTLIPCFILTTCSLPLQVRPSPHPPGRENRRRYLRTNEEPGCREAGALDVSPKELHKLQDIDESYGRRRLIVAPSAAAGETSFAKMGYSISYTVLRAQMVMPTTGARPTHSTTTSNLETGPRYTNGWTSWQEDSRLYSQSILLARDVSEHSGALQNLWSLPKFVGT